MMTLNRLMHRSPQHALTLLLRDRGVVVIIESDEIQSTGKACLQGPVHHVPVAVHVHAGTF